MLREYTTMPLPNQPLAIAFIIDNAALVDSRYADMMARFHLLTADRKTNRASALVMRIVHDFMARHPRGSDTSGDVLKREFYAACYAIKVKSSRHKYYGRSERYKIEQVKTFTEEKRAAFLMFDAAGGTTSGAQFSKIDLATFEGCDYITGWWHGAARPEKIWLTDLGIKAYALARNIQTKVEKIKAAEGFEPGDICRQRGEWVTSISLRDTEESILIRGKSEDRVLDLRNKVLAVLKADAMA